MSFYLPDHPQQLEVPLVGPTGLGEVLANLGIPIAEIYLVVVNGELVESHNALVSQEDDVKLFPPMDGG